MLQRKSSNSGSLSWKSPFAMKNNLLKLADVSIEKDLVEKFVNCNDVDTFRNVFRKEMKKQISGSSTLQDALDIQTVLNSVGLNIAQFKHLSDNAVKLNNLIISAKIKAEKDAQIKAEKDAKIKK